MKFKKVKVIDNEIEVENSFVNGLKQLGERAKEIINGADYIDTSNYYAFIPGFLVKDVDKKLGISRDKADEGSLIIGEDCTIFATDDRTYLLDCDE